MPHASVITELATRDRTTGTLKRMGGTIRGFAARSSASLAKVGSGFKMVGGAIGGVAMRLGKLALAGGAAATAMAGVVAVLSAKGWAEQEKVEKRLEQTIKATGGAAGWTKDQLLDHAKALQKVTTFGDEAIIGSQALLATFTSIKGDQFKQATEMAMNLSVAMGQDLKQSAIMLGKALNDPATGLSAMSRAGVSFTESEKTVIKAMQEAGDMAGAQTKMFEIMASQGLGGQARAEAETFAGRMKQLKNTIGDVAEQFGKILAPYIDKVAGGFRNLVARFEGDGGKLAARVSSIVDKIAKAIAWVVKKLALGVAAGAAFVQSFKAEAAAAFVTLWLKVLQFVNRIKHAFTRTIPEVLKWMAKNWKSILMDMVRVQGQLLMNAGKNIAAFLKAAKDAALMRGWNFQGTNMFAGLDTAIRTELPRLSKRIPSVMEKSLMEELQARPMGAAFGVAFAKNRATMDRMLGAFAGSGIPDGSGQGGGAFVGSGGDDAVAGGTKARGFEGLDALYGRIATAALNDPVKAAAIKTEEHTKRAADAAERQARLAEDHHRTMGRLLEVMEAEERNKQPARAAAVRG